MVRLMPICIGCSHHRANNTCTAFPNGIPEKILFSEFDHRKPFTGDNGIQFDPLTREDERYADSLFENGEFEALPNSVMA